MCTYTAGTCVAYQCRNGQGGQDGVCEVFAVYGCRGREPSGAFAAVAERSASITALSSAARKLSLTLTAPCHLPLRRKHAVLRIPVGRESTPFLVALGAVAPSIAARVADASVQTLLRVFYPRA